MAKDLFDEIHEKTQKDENPTHDFGEVTGFEEKSGLPIVRRKESKQPQASSEGEKQEAGVPRETSDRPVIQPSDDPSTNQQLATAGLKEIMPAIEKIVASVPGAKIDAVRPEKDPQRTQEKIDKEGKPANTVPDYSALRISVDSLEDNDKLVDAIKQQFPIAKEKNEMEQGDPDNGFHALMLQIEAPNGATVECQILPKEQADIAEDSHGQYAQARDGDPDAKASLKQQNGAAMDSFKARNSEGMGDSGSPEQAAAGAKTPAEAKGKSDAAGKPAPLAKGAHVALPDGRSARVDFHDHKITGNARVTADDGEKIQSIPGKHLTVVTPTEGKANSPHVAVDLDGTLAKYDKFEGPTKIGAPIPAMVEKVKAMLAKGEDVRIMTARVADDKDGKATRAIQAWCQKYLGQTLPVTNVKDQHMKALYDDRAVAVEKNTGKVLGGEEPPEGKVRVASHFRNARQKGNTKMASNLAQQMYMRRKKNSQPSAAQAPQPSLPTQVSPATPQLQSDAKKKRKNWLGSK